MERTPRVKMKIPLLSRIGSWLRGLVRKEQRADPEWEEEVRREQTGKMGEDIHLPGEAAASERRRGAAPPGGSVASLDALGRGERPS
jgi:hypothetical protein